MVFLYISCVSAPPTLPPTVWRVPAGFRIVGYFPSWSGDPETVRYQALTHINYAFAFVDPTGAYRPVEAPEKLDSVVARAHAAGGKVLISVADGNDGEVSAFGVICSDPVRIQRFVQGTLNFLAVFHLDGADIDWEFPGADTSAGYAALISALAEALHARGLMLSLAVGANDVRGQFVSDQVWQAADWLNVMAYDDRWGNRVRSPHSTYAFTRSALDYWLETRQVPAPKVVVGVPFYGRSLIDRHSRTYRSLLEQFPEAAASDVAGGFSYNGPDTMRAKIVNQARLRAGGVMIWQLNQDARGSSSLLSLIYDTVKEPSEE
jgi:GH18 family chitinase